MLVLNSAKTVQRLPNYSQSINKKQIKGKWPYLRGIPFSEYDNAQLGILIGEDHAFVVAPQLVVKQKPYTPIDKKTPLGWTISGKISTEPVSKTSFVNYVFDQSEKLENQQLP